MYQRTALGQQEILERKYKIPSRARTLLLLIESHDLNRLDRKIANTENFEVLISLGLITVKNPATPPQTNTESHVQHETLKSTLEPNHLNTTTALSRLRLLKDKITNSKLPIAQAQSENNFQPTTIVLDPQPNTLQNITISPIDHTITKIKTDALDGINSTLNHALTSQIEEELPPLNFHDIKIIMQDTLRQYCGLMAKHLIHAIEEAKTTQELRLYQKKWLTNLFETRISHQNLTILKNQINLSIQYIEANQQPK